MVKSDIVKVWGTADSIYVSFVKSGDKWVCNVPADLSDGTYACRFFAKSQRGTTVMWTGFLYMCNGICHFEFKKCSHTIDFIEEQKYRIGFLKECDHFE